MCATDPLQVILTKFQAKQMWAVKKIKIICSLTLKAKN